MYVIVQSLCLETQKKLKVLYNDWGSDCSTNMQTRYDNINRDIPE